MIEVLWRQVYHFCAVNVRTSDNFLIESKRKAQIVHHHLRRAQSPTIWLIIMLKKELGKLRFHHRRSHSICWIFGLAEVERMKRKNKISIINALLEWIFRSENFFAHFHFQLWNRFSLSNPFINRKILLKLKISYFTRQNAIIFLRWNTISYHFANFAFFYLLFVHF